MKRNVPLLGFVIGAILPLIGMFIVYLILFQGIALEDFIKQLRHTPSQATKVISLGILINIIPFIFYTNKRLDLTARGIFIATMLYAVFMLLIKFVWN
ncbi:hypothetical protein CAP35_02800 [Chitinophagaceae bacterium IBVUCB1]|nr:hypothetical protein CAP35_02800 [Chitinophagaceae bacterium IBVUCB1]